MAFVLKDESGQIVAASPDTRVAPSWQEVDNADSEYLVFLERQLEHHHAFRESDIQLARVLEDLVSILIDRNLISFTDFPSQAQRRLGERQRMRQRNHLNSLIDEDDLSL